MGVSAKPRTAFGEKLRAELTRKNVSIRQLSRRLDPNSPEAARRNLTRWIAGTRPTKTSRVAVAVALDVAPDYFDEDDEEEDSEMADLVRALMHRIDQRVEEGLERRLGVSA
jgi:transcriptional regulator with XRE-family HTH domain